MLVLSGDIHGDPFRFSAEDFPLQEEMVRDDYVLILGDFGLIWNYDGETKEESEYLNWLEKRNFTTLFIDGNHENFNRLNSYPLEEWNGGLVHKIRPHVLHLMRGYVFNIDGCKCFTFGGARSHDISDGIIDPDECDDWRAEERIWERWGRYYFRIKNISWWEAEMPSKEEMDTGLKSLNSVNWNVDYVFTHCAPASDVALLGFGSYEQDELTKYFENIRVKLQYKHWYFGHYHTNRRMNDRETCLYTKIERIV